MNYVIKDYEIIGTVKLSTESIVFTRGNDIQHYPINELAHLEVFLLGIKGEFYAGRAITTKIGTDNFVKFQCNLKSVEVRFLMEEKNALPLNNVLKSWTESQTKFKLHNQTKYDFGK
ncbi:hypothetical protein [Chitinophaga rhizosphaerae]|uniref:hypothetical protein n=1 Tax=Chitinophaga rhizosphaerae TaxID=1864947 RepID=UPI000F80B7BA|nr:hypothetical protein [Chitinophaga rhizosphaerae]